jgi:hypothetical protein
MSDFANRILSSQTRTQPVSRVTAPPLAGPGSGVVAADVPRVIEAKAPPAYLPDGGVCIDSPPDSWDFQWTVIHYTGVFPDGMVGDKFIQLARPVRKLFMVGNNSPKGSVLFIHFVPLGKYPPSGVIGEIQGNEPWIPFPGGGQFNSIAGGGPNGAGLTDCSYIKFCKPISKFYVTVYNGSGAGPADQGWNITLLATDDIDIEYSNAP